MWQRTRMLLLSRARSFPPSLLESYNWHCFEDFGNQIALKWHDSTCIQNTEEIMLYVYIKWFYTYPNKINKLNKVDCDFFRLLHFIKSTTTKNNWHSKHRKGPEDGKSRTFPKSLYVHTIEWLYDFSTDSPKMLCHSEWN